MYVYVGPIRGKNLIFKADLILKIMNFTIFNFLHVFWDFCVNLYVFWNFIIFWIFRNLTMILITHPYDNMRVIYSSWIYKYSHYQYMCRNHIMEFEVKICKKHYFRSFSFISIRSSALQSSIIINEEPYQMLRFKVFFFSRVMVKKCFQSQIPTIFLRISHT